MRLVILSIAEQPDGSRRLSVREASAPSMSVAWNAYCPKEPWNANWAAGDVIDVDAREKTSASGNRYLTIYPTPSMANEEPREIADGDAIRVMHLSLSAQVAQGFAKLNRKLNMALGIEEADDDVPQPNFKQ